MRQIHTLVVLALAVSGHASVVNAQGPDEVKRLKAELELLRRQLKAAEKEIELQKREISLLKKEAKTTSEAAEDERAKEKSSPKDKLGDVEFELIRCVRDPKTRTRVAFTIGMKCDNRIIDYFLAPYQLALFDGDGAALDIKVVKGPTLTRDFFDTPRYKVKLPKGELIKYQIIIDGVKEGLSLLDRVELTQPPRGLVIDKVVFKRIKIGEDKRGRD